MGDRLRKLAAGEPATGARWHPDFLRRRRQPGGTGQSESCGGPQICKNGGVEDYGHRRSRWRLYGESRGRVRHYSHYEPGTRYTACGSVSGRGLASAGFAPRVKGSPDKVGIRSRTMNARRAVFLDRDGVLNEPILREGRPYPPSGLHELIIVPGAETALARLKQHGFLLVVVTNQPDVG